MLFTQCYFSLVRKVSESQVVAVHDRELRFGTKFASRGCCLDVRMTKVSWRELRSSGRSSREVVAKEDVCVFSIRASQEPTACEVFTRKKKAEEACAGPSRTHNSFHYSLCGKPGARRRQTFVAGARLTPSGRL